MIKDYVYSLFVVVVAPALHVCKADGSQVSSNIYQSVAYIYSRGNFEKLSVLGEGNGS